MHLLIEKIKAKPELSGLPDSLIAPILEKQLRKLNIKDISKNEKTIIKAVRAELRKTTGQFPSHKAIYSSNMEEMLKSHKSTRERLEFYPELIKIIENLNVKSILDLGCGLNPIALCGKIKYLEYYAYDIDKNSLDIVERYFKDNKINGQTFNEDITKSVFPKTDICLMFKILDAIDIKNHKPSEELIKKIPSKLIIASFPTKTLSGRPMRHPQRGWIERMLSRIGYSYKTIISKNEIFYIIEKT